MSALATTAATFLEHCQGRGLAPATMKNYRWLLDLALPLIASRGCQEPADVSPADLEAVMAQALEDRRAKKTRVQLAVLLKQFFEWLHDQGRVIVDPTLTLPLPDDGEADLPDPPLSEAEVRALFDALPRRSVIDLRNACLLELLYGCALRISEAIRLDLTDVDLARRVVVIRASKHDQDRVVPIMGTAEAATQDYLAIRRTLLKGPDTGALFLSQYGKRLVLASVYGLFQDLNTRRGPGMRHLHPHLFRHSIAVHLLRGGADVRHIQHFLSAVGAGAAEGGLRAGDAGYCGG